MYDLKQEKLIGNGLAWHAPADLISDAEAIELSNFRIDQLGFIRSRPGHSSLASALGNVHTLINFQGTRYAGGGTSLYRNLTGAAVAAGFDGNPLGVVSWRKFLLVSNQNNPTGFTSPVKVNASSVSRMIPAAPAVAPVITKQAEKVTVVSTFDNTETWTTSGGTLTFDASDKQVGTHSLKLVVTDPGIYTVSRAATPNLNSVGAQTGSDDDKHRIWIKVNDFSQIGDITVLVDVSAAGDNTQVYSARIPRKKFKKASGNWVLFELRRASSIMDVLIADPSSQNLLQSVASQEFNALDGFTVTDLPLATQTLLSGEALVFERIGNDDTRTWANVTNIRVQMEFLGATTVRLDEWEVFGSAIGQLEGKYQWAYAYTTADSTESNPSPISLVTKANRISHGVAVIASADPQVTGINVYRGGSILGTFYRDNTAPLANTTTTYISTALDVDVLNNPLMESNHDDPVAAAGMIGPYVGRIIQFNTAANPNRYWWSEVNQLFFPGSGDFDGFWSDVGASGEAIVAITQHQGFLNIYKVNQIWREEGDPGADGGQQVQLPTKIGCVGPRAVCTGDVGDCFASQEGIYVLGSGGIPQKISQKIEPIFRGQTVTLATGVTIPPISSSQRAKITVEWIAGRLYVSYPESGQSVNNVSIVFHFETQRWYRDSRGFSVLYNDSNVLLGGTSGGAVLQLETGTGDAGSVIAVVYQSKYQNCGTPDAQKSFEDFEIECDPNGATLTLTAYMDNGGTSVALGTVTGTGLQKFTKQFAAAAGVKAFNCSIRVTGSSSSAEIIIQGMWLHYYPHARKASSFDTDASNLGSPGVKEIRQLELDIDCSATTTLNVLTDLPSNVMTSRETPTLPLTSGRRVIPNILTSRWRGYLSRFYVDDGSAQFQMYGMRAEYKVIGDYVVANELWDTDELSFGSEKVKASRAIQIELENTANVTVKIYTDLPGGALILRETLPVITSGARRVIDLSFLSNAEYRGRIIRVTMSSTADWALYGASLEVRTIGGYVFGSAGKIYDSDPLDFGTEKPKGMRALEIELENTANVTVKVYSDLPGGMTLRETLPVIAAGGRRVVDLAFLNNAEYRGHLFQFKISSASDFIIYGIRGETRPIGTYVFGASGKQYDSGEIDFGTERVKFAKEVEIDFESSATLTLDSYSDLPGGALTLRLSPTTATTGSVRKTAKFRLPGTFFGRLLRFKIRTAATDFILYEVRVFSKFVGEPNATPWAWRDLPLTKTQEGVWSWASSPVEKTQEAIWNWAALPVLKTPSGQWNWFAFPVDKIA